MSLEWKARQSSLIILCVVVIMIRHQEHALCAGEQSVFLRLWFCRASPYILHG